MNKYQFIEEKYIKEIDSTVKFVKHNKSGMRVLLIKNTDPNKVFCVGFRTPPADSTGVPHIMEHSTLCGSKKFPVKDPFVELIKSSLNNFINAMTFPDKTIYPFASTNLKDFKNLMEVYMDAVFFPNVYIHEEIFKQEGWHYELDSLDGDITINGVVYNEMKGVFSDPEDIIFRNSSSALFPDNAYGVESGGHPDNIPDLTYEQFKYFHSRYYSPSNGYIILYGDLDMDERLEWMDKEYLSKFDKIEVDSDIPYQKPFKEPQFIETEYAIGKEDSKENKAYYSYGAVVGTYKDSELSLAMSILNYVLLDAPGAPLKQMLLDKGLGVDISSMFDDGMKQSALMIISKNAPLNKSKEFYETIEGGLRKISKEGIDKNALLSAINFYEFRARELDFGGFPKGIVFAINSLNTWLYDESDPTSGLEQIKLFDSIKKKVNTRYFEEIIEKYILNNTHKAIVTLNPSNDYAEKKEQELKDKLALYKKSLSKEELEKLIEDTKALKIYQQTPSTKEELATMPKLTREDINKKAEPLCNEIIDVDGVKVVKHDIDTRGITYLKLSFNTSKVPNELIPYISILKESLGNFNTEKHSYLNLNQEININTGGISYNTRVIGIEESYNPYFEISARVFDDKLGFVFEILKEILLTTSFDDEKRMNEVIQEFKSKFQGNIISDGHSFAMGRASSYYDEGCAYSETLSGIENYKFIENISKKVDTKDISNKLNKLLNIIFRKENLTVSYTNTNDNYKEYLPAFISSLYKDKYEEGRFVFVPEMKNEAFKMPSQVQFVALSGSYKNVGRYHGSLEVLKTNLRYDYLWVQVRVLGGAYGVMYFNTLDGRMSFVTYRDPNLSKSLETFKNVPNYIDTLELDENSITSSIISAISRIDVPFTPRTKGDNSYDKYLSGVTIEDIQKTRDELINTTMEDIKKLKKLYVEVISNPAICVVGSESKIEEDSADFKVKKNLFE